MLDGSWRKPVDAAVAPVGRALQRIRVTPDLLTVVGVLMAAGASVIIGSGRLVIGVILLTAAGLPDLLDGAVAKASGRASKRGAFFDSVSDRLTDTLLLGGVAWYLTSRDGGHAGMLAVAVLGASFLISYQRAKAESLGYDAKGGIMERAERTILLGVGVAIGRLLVPILWILLVLSIITAIQRFVKVWKQAEAPVPLPSRRLHTSRTFREWREAVAVERDNRRSQRRTRGLRESDDPRSEAARNRAITRANRQRSASPTSNAASLWRERLVERRAGKKS